MWAGMGRAMLKGMTLRCLIVDDDARFGEAGRALLERQGIAVVALATSSGEATRRVQELAPDVALIDIELGVVSVFDLAQRLAGGPGRPPRSVMLMSMHDELEFVELIEASPAVGFLAKAKLSADRIYHLLAHGRDSGGNGI
jgi:CheY-like chemotaxis protein